MSLCSSLMHPKFQSLFTKPFNDHKPIHLSRFRASADVPGFLSAHWLESRRKRPFGPRLNFSAEEAVQCQLEALKYNDQPRPDYGIEVMYRFTGFDPFERSTYFGPFFDLGQKVGGSWNGYWLTESVLHDGKAFFRWPGLLSNLADDTSKLCKSVMTCYKI